MKATVKTVLSVLLVTALLFVTVWAPFGLARAFHHDCGGEDCPVCALILACASAYAHLTRAAVILLCAGICLIRTVLREMGDMSRPGSVDPVGRGIRLLN